ncbi:MAG: hypothetical protein R3E88_21510 [Myxococcota bacterium]
MASRSSFPLPHPLPRPAARRFRLAAPLALLAILLAAPAALAARDQSKASGSFENTGALPAASGKLNLRFAENRSQLQLQLRGLTDDVTYEVRVDGVAVDTFDPDRSGRVTLRYESPKRNRRASSLDFDPRGAVLSIHDGVNDVLVADLSNGSASTGLVVSDQTLVQSMAVSGGGSARARTKIYKDGRQSFDVELQGVVPGTYDLYVDGVLRGQIVTTPAGRGKIEFDTKPHPKKGLLDFDPRGAVIDVVQGTTSVFAGPLLPRAGGVSACNPAENEIFLGAIVSPGKAKVRLRTRDDCDRDLRIEVEEIAVGTYDVVVDGIVRGQIAVAFDAMSGENEGEIEFDTDPDDPHEVLLDFEPDGALIEIAQGASVLFSGSLATGGTTPPTACAAIDLLTPLVPTSAAPGASGDARFREKDDCDRDFSVEAEDVPVGDYDLFVGGVLRGTVAVRLDPKKGDVQGELEFESHPKAGKELLDFDPRGALVEVKQGATLYLSATLGGTPSGGGGGGGGGGSSCVESSTELPLLNEGVIGSAKGKVRVRTQDDCDDDLRIEIEKVPVGSYGVRIGGVVRASLVVAFNPSTGENEGEVEFDTTPDDPNEILMDFDPTGALVEIEQGATVILARQLP